MRQRVGSFDAQSNSVRTRPGGTAPNAYAALRSATLSSATVASSTVTTIRKPLHGVGMHHGRQGTAPGERLKHGARCLVTSRMPCIGLVVDFGSVLRFPGLRLEARELFWCQQAARDPVAERVGGRFVHRHFSLQNTLGEIANQRGLRDVP